MITAVTVLEDRANITRKHAQPVAAGQHRIVIERVSPVLVDKTLTAAATGARVLDVRCERYLAPWRDPKSGSTDKPAALRDERVRLERDRDAALARVEAARAEIDGLAAIVAAALHDMAVGASRGTAVNAAGAQLAELDEIEAQARARRIDAELDAEDLDRALARLDARISAADAESVDEAARLIVDVIADQATDIVLTIGYVVPGAAWRPYHRAVLS
nr:DUF4140 domain-containing protein [Deltaproteobacteria bacterium]